MAIVASVAEESHGSIHASCDYSGSDGLSRVLTRFQHVPEKYEISLFPGDFVVFVVLIVFGAGGSEVCTFPALWNESVGSVVASTSTGSPLLSVACGG